MPRSRLLSAQPIFLYGIFLFLGGCQQSGPLTNQAGAAARITATAGTPQSAAINAAFAAPLQATVTDSGSNPVSGVTVTFTAPAFLLSPVDANVNLGAATPSPASPGTQLTQTILNNGTIGGTWSSSVGTASAMTVGAHQAACSLPVNVSVGGFQYGPSSASQSFALNDASSFSYWLMNPLGSRTKVSYGLCFTPGYPSTATGSPADMVSVWFANGDGVIFQLCPGRSGSGCGGYNLRIETISNSTVFHSSKIAAATGTAYWCTLLADSGAGNAQLACYNPSAWEQVGSTVSATLRVSGSKIAHVYVGNAEAFTGTGTTYFENLIFDYTNAAFPLGVGNGSPSASGTFANGAATTVSTTDTSGVATSSTFTANATAGGPYNVTASVAGVLTAANFALTNSPGTTANNAVFLPGSTGSGTVKWPIKISASNRYFVDQNGGPLMMVADAAHHLMPALPQSAVSQYLSDRVAHGFNTIHLYGACAGSGTCSISGAANNGALPFTTGSSFTDYDLSTPNPAYWLQVDNVISEAASLGLVVLFDPLQLGANSGPVMENTTGPLNYPINDFNFGVFLGTRYKNFPNIIWQFGQDFAGSALPSPALMDTMAQVMAGVASADPNHLITSRLNLYRSYSQQGIPIGNSLYNSTLNVSFVSTYYETYDYVLAAYNASPIMPVLLGEANYETANNTGLLSSNANAFITRAQMWWTMTSGATGFEFGNAHVSNFDSSWMSNLDTTATLQVQYLTNFFNQIPWWTLVPDTSQKIVTFGGGTYSPNNENLYNATYATTTWDPDGSLAIIYTPVATTLTVNMANFSKTMKASWYDPTTGRSSPIGSFENAGSQNFTTVNAAHRDGRHDWVLVLR